MRKYVYFVALVLIVFVALVMVSCAVNPVTGQQEFMMLSEQDESKMGLETDQSIVDQYGVYNDSGLQNYLQAMGLTMGSNSHRPNLNWQFKVMDTPVVNAFAAPGGYIYVTRWLFAAVNPGKDASRSLSDYP